GNRHSIRTRRRNQPGRAGQQDHRPHLQRRGRLGQRLRHGDFGPVARTRTAVPGMVCLEGKLRPRPGAVRARRRTHLGRQPHRPARHPQGRRRQPAHPLRRRGGRPRQGRAVCARKGRCRAHAPHRLRPRRGHVGPDRTADPGPTVGQRHPRDRLRLRV
ncbi:MAG: hypothetical protein AVDCRST_MAG56-3241, partial [uncultured Cytophagales bacterium]